MDNPGNPIALVLLYQNRRFLFVFFLLLRQRLRVTILRILIPTVFLIAAPLTLILTTVLRTCIRALVRILGILSSLEAPLTLKVLIVPVSFELLEVSVDFWATLCIKITYLI